MGFLNVACTVLSTRDAPMNKTDQIPVPILHYKTPNWIHSFWWDLLQSISHTAMRDSVKTKRLVQTLPSLNPLVVFSIVFRINLNLPSILSYSRPFTNWPPEPYLPAFTSTHYALEPQ